MLVGSDEVEIISILTYSSMDSQETEFASDIIDIMVQTFSGNSMNVAVDVNSGIGITIDAALDSELDSAIRQSLSCQYLDRETNSWVLRGTYLRGIKFSIERDLVANDTNIVTAGICVTTHLTQFAVIDEGEEHATISKKVNAVGDRITTMAGIDLLDADTEITPLIPSLIGVSTLIFIGSVVLSKFSQPKEAVDVARRVFMQYGRLSRPVVLGNDERRAILRGWLHCGLILKLFFLNLLVNSPYLCLLFQWSHDSLIYTVGDKAYLLYSALLSTFVVQALIMDIDSESNPTFEEKLLQIFFGAALANTVFCPIQYMIPYMATNVNSFKSNTILKESIVSKQWRRMVKGLCYSNRATHPKNQPQSIIKQWNKLLFEDFIDSCAKKDLVQNFQTIPKSLRFFKWRIPLVPRRLVQGQVAAEMIIRQRNKNPLKRLKQIIVDIKACKRLQKISGKDNGVERRMNILATRIQRRFHRFRKLKRSVRMVEFEEWYHGCRDQRIVLQTILIIFLCLLFFIVVVVCTLVSAVFTDQQAVQWLTIVAQSIIMQIIVTGPLLAGFIFTCNLLVSTCMLHAWKKINEQAKQVKVVPVSAKSRGIKSEAKSYSGQKDKEKPQIESIPTTHTKVEIIKLTSVSMDGLRSNVRKQKRKKKRVAAASTKEKARESRKRLQAERLKLKLNVVEYDDAFDKRDADMMHVEHISL